MKKKISLLITVVLLVFIGIVWMTTGGGGNTSEYERNVGASLIYTSDEINDAMDVVESTFQNEYKGCYLIELTYDEALSSLYCGQWEEQYGADQAIVLTSVFDVSASGGDGSLNPNSTYSGWQWVLTRNGQGDWQLQTSGY